MIEKLKNAVLLPLKRALSRMTSPVKKALNRLSGPAKKAQAFMNGAIKKIWARVFGPLESIRARVSGPLQKARPYLIALAAALAATAIVGWGALFRVDKWAQDWLYQHPGVTSSDIVIIGIDDEALDILGPYNTWDRNVMAYVLEALAADPENKPAVTAIDVLYAGTASPEEDHRLAKAAAELGNVVTACMAQFGTSVTWENGHAVDKNDAAVVGFEQPYDALRSVTTQGHINAMTDTDGVMRHAILYVEPEEGRTYSMAHEAARLFLEKQGKTLRDPAVGGTGLFYVSFTGKPGDYSDGVSLAWVMEGDVPSGYWADKIVLIGPYAPALQDAFFTPMEKGEQMYGVEFQANVIQSLMEGSYKNEVSDRIQLIVLFVLCAVAMALFLKLKTLWGGAVCFGLILVSAGSTFLLFRFGLIAHPLWIPVAVLALYLGAVGVHYAQAAKERQKLALKNERITAELSLATRIQANSLPKVFPPFPDWKEFDLYASMTPAKEVGGDLYDFFLIDDDHLCLVIGDVSGKGIPAALFMMVASSLIYHAAMKETSPAKVLTLVNEQICSRNPEEMFVTVWLAVLEISTGKLTATSAGHEYPALKKAGESFELFKDRHGVAVGAMDGVRYREYTIDLEPGTKIFVYTDGVAEATNSNEELFGTDRMIAALRNGENGTPRDVLKAVKAGVDEFVGKAPQFDDLTMLCLQYMGPEKTQKEEPAAEAPAD
ncbi:MAG: SpoIIE family protein phosphatase [Clostridia bacterium]|nr:SpoIIE family protein phosphatase [Clostridia bacterium]